jgi:predicted translin family RNA/ssDNA-binding protein
MGELNVTATGTPYLSKILTTGSSETLDARGKQALKKIESEVSYLLRIIEDAPDNYLGYLDIAESLHAAVQEFVDAGTVLDTVGSELEKRDRIDG